MYQNGHVLPSKRPSITSPGQLPISDFSDAGTGPHYLPAEPPPPPRWNPGGVASLFTKLAAAVGGGAL